MVACVLRTVVSFYLSIILYIVLFYLSILFLTHTGIYIMKNAMVMVGRNGRWKKLKIKIMNGKRIGGKELRKKLQQ